MFRSRISFSFSRIFRLRNRRLAKDSASSGPPKSYHPFSSQVEPINIGSTTPTPQSPSVSTHSPGETAAQSSPTPIVIIGQDPAHPSVPPPPIVGVSGSIGPQIYLDGVLLPESPSVRTRLSTREASFQVTPTLAEDPPDSPLPTCSTLVSHDVDNGVGSVVPPELTITPAPDAATGSHAAVACGVSIPLDNEISSGVRLESGRVRPMTLFAPQPVRAHKGRFSMPASHAAHAAAKTRARESKRLTLMPIGPGARDKRKSRWSREMSKQETREVLRVLCEF